MIAYSGIHLVFRGTKELEVGISVMRSFYYLCSSSNTSRMMKSRRMRWAGHVLRFGGFPCFFLSYKANARVKPTKMGHGPHSSKSFVLFYVLFVLCRSVCVCKCVLYCCNRVATQLQLTNISYHKKKFVVVKGEV